LGRLWGSVMLFTTGWWGDQCQSMTLSSGGVKIT
jgi:hypothetical protein